VIANAATNILIHKKNLIVGKKCTYNVSVSGISVPDPDRKFSGLPDPDPLVRVTGSVPNPDPHVSRPPESGSDQLVRGIYSSGSGSFTILLSSSKNSKKNLDSYCVVTSFGLFIIVK
jgi:hypothetical protein